MPTSGWQESIGDTIIVSRTITRRTTIVTVGYYNLEGPTEIRKWSGQVYQCWKVVNRVKQATMDVEAALLLKENPCSTCKKEVLDEEQALLCDICEWWEHLQCIKVCERPTIQCYNVLTELPCKSIVFTCSRCRRKGTLARWLFHSEVALKSTQVQKDVYERLLQEKQQQVDHVFMDKSISVGKPLKE